MLRRLFATLALIMLAGTTGAQAQDDYPTGVITIVVPFSAGGPTDTVTRLVAQAMSTTLGQQVIVENVGGAGGTLGAARVAKAEPDGYTLLLHHIGMATTMTLYRQLPYNSIEDFQPIGLVTEVPMTLVAKKDLAPTSLAELIDYVKANKDTVTYANAGIGAASHLCGMLFMSAIDTQLTTVAYKGTGPAMNDLLGGQVDFMCDQTTNTTSQIKSGKVKAYAVTSAKRVPSLPDVPTLAEVGVKGAEVGIWHGLYAPKGTPKPVIDKLVSALQAALKDETVQKRFADLGATTVPVDQQNPAALQKHLKAEIDKWAPLIKKAGQYAD
jgi:tripartite-type tricarboxylate transporter receptor subunit TctC